MLTPPADVTPVLDQPAELPLVDLPAVEALRATGTVEVVDLHVAALHDGALAEATTVDGCAPEGTVAALVAPRAPRRARSRGRTPAAATAARPDGDGPGSAA
jgi:hypothetical protein